MAGNSVKTVMDGKLLKQIGTGNLISTAVSIGAGAMTYRDAREKGGSAIGSAARAVGETIMVDVLGLPTYLGMMAAGAAPKAAVKGYEGLARQARSMSNTSRHNPFNSANFMDSQQAYTMRQAGMQLAKASKYNLQQTLLGNEAQYLHL